MRLCFQLGTLLDSAQALLADTMPAAMMAQQQSTALKTATGTTPAVYSCFAMQVKVKPRNFCLAKGLFTQSDTYL
jgi:hypothetical protein